MMTIRRYLREYWLLMAAIVVLMIIGTYFELLIPGYISELMEAIEHALDVNSKFVPMMLVATIAFLLAMAVAYLSGRLSALISHDMREDIFIKISELSEAEVSHFSIPSLTTRTLNDVNQIQKVFSMILLAFIKAPIMFIIAICMIYGMNVEWTAVLILYTAALIISIVLCILFVNPKMRKMQKLLDNQTAVTNDNLVGVREIRSYNGEEFRHKLFVKASMRVSKNTALVQRGLASTNAFVLVIMNTIAVMIYLLSAYTIDGMEVLEIKFETLNSMIAFAIYATMIFSSIITLFNAFFFYPQAAAADRRIGEVLSSSTSITSGSAEHSDDCSGSIVFENVSFRYPGGNNDALSGINIAIKPGETVGIVGSNGSGKSSLISLIPRIYDVTGGSVKVDGIDVREYDLDALHSKIAFVPQKAIILNRSIAGNVGYGDLHGNPTEEEIEKAIRIASMDELIESKPEGSAHIVQEGGSDLSGGQKQRICIARAICKKSEIYIFDDSFSALDYKTDRNVRKAIAEETKGSTVLIVSHRASTIMNADKIIVLDKGRIVDAGTHSELKERCEVYREIVESQTQEDCNDE